MTYFKLLEHCFLMKRSLQGGYSTSFVYPARPRTKISDDLQAMTNPKLKFSLVALLQCMFIMNRFVN